MVKIFSRFFCIILAACFLSNCTIDLPGLVVSHDLDDRLTDRNNFNYPALRNRDDLFLITDYSFIVLSDTHIEGQNTFGLEKIKNVIQANNADSNNLPIRFAVITGDITQMGSQTEINTFLNFARDLGVPCYPVIGNHDIYFGNWSNWKSSIGSTNYRVDGFGATLFVLDSANGFFGKAQLDWLEREIQNTEEKVFVFTHTNLFAETPIELQQVTDTRERARIMSILRGRCDMMFMGHIHFRMQHEVGGVRYLTIEDYRSSQVYCKVSVTDNGIEYSFNKL